MSEPNNNNHPKAEGKAKAPAGAKDDVEFVVHTKHTCDVCFEQPIIGRRYTSGDRSNFDLCARCFKDYSGPDIGLSETVMGRDKKQSSDFVLKLKIDNGGEVQVRRITVSEIWDESISQMSFGKMMSIASSYALPKNKIDDDSALDDFIAKAKATYIDEDGDRITMTSNKELQDSFLQVLKKLPLRKPFRITVTVPVDSPSKIPAGKATGMTKRMQRRKNANSLAATMEVSPKEVKSQSTQRDQHYKFEKDFFIHARHTCDGCSKSPIIGTRHHATKIPDFDLCGACFEKYEGEDLDFKPEIHDRDRRMQHKWLRRQLKSAPKMSTNITGMWSKANGNIADFLKNVQEAGGNIESATVYSSPPRAGFISASETKNSAESPPVEKGSQGASGEGLNKDVKLQKQLDGELENLEQKEQEATLGRQTAAVAGVESPPTPKLGTPSVEAEASSSTESRDESFLSDADGNGSIAEAIGHTLDVCVQAIEEAIAGETKEIDEVGDAVSKERPKELSHSKESADVDAAVTVAADAFSVASSMVSSMSDILKTIEDAKKLDAGNGSHADLLHSNYVDDTSAGVPSTVTSATILKSEQDIEEENDVEVPRVEDVIDGEDEWSVISDDNVQIKNGEDIVSTEAKAAKKEYGIDKSVSSVEPLSPFVLAKWDNELIQLHELGFLNDRANIDVLEHLEASLMGVDSTEELAIQKVVEHLLGGRA